MLYRAYATARAQMKPVGGDLFCFSAGHLTDGRYGGQDQDVAGPVEELLEGVRAALHSRQTGRTQQVSDIDAALRAYAAATEHALATAYAKEHQLRVPKPAGVTADKCAQRLLSLVQQLPELSDAPRPEAPKAVAPAGTSNRRPVNARQATVSGSAPRVSQTLLGALGSLPLVVVGGKPHPERMAGPDGPLGQRLEWVDTQSNGSSAIGNLAQRMRQGRVGALVVLEGLISHKHSDPLVQAARVSGTPHAYGGKGGQAAVRRALQQLEKMFVQRS